MNKIYEKYIESNKKEIAIICIGTPKYCGDSIGPRVGSKLKEMYNDIYEIYGTLEEPVHGINYPCYYEKINHNKFIIAIDAGITELEDCKIVYRDNIHPGAGVKKELKAIGDLGIMGAVKLPNKKDIFDELKDYPQSKVDILVNCIINDIQEFLVLKDNVSNQDIYVPNDKQFICI